MTEQHQIEPGNMNPSGSEPLDTHYEVALDDEVEATRAPVYVDVVTREHDRRPILPAALRRGNRVPAVRQLAGRTGHRIGYHALRSPWYTLLATFWAVVGAGRLTKRQLAWWWVLEQHQLRQEAANKNDPDTWYKLHREAKATRTWRGMVLLAELLGVVVGVLLLVTVAPWWVRPLAVVVGVLFLAPIGRPVDRRIINAAVVTPRYRLINSDVVLRAYYAAGLGRPDKEDQRIKFGSRMERDGEGGRVTVILPYGRTFDDAMKARTSIASGLDVSDTQVFITKDKTSIRQHLLWVADRDPLAIPAGRTPLLACRPTDIWKPAPFGVDERNRKVCVDLMWQSLLVGAQPRKGKTFAGRLVALFAALDPYVRISLADGKNAPDWRKFTLVADRTIFGTAISRNGDPFERLIDMLEEIKTDALDRNERLSALPTNVCPEGKLTREIARDPKYRMPVRLVVLEEFQEYLENGTKEQSRKIAALFCFLVKVAPSVGIITLSLTQKPSGIGGDVETQRLFVNFRDNHALRFALRCGSWQVSNAVLGGDAQSEGYDASTLPLGPEYKGIGYLYGAGDEVPLTRTYLADLEDAEKILTAARRIREQVGTLSGEAAGEDVARASRDVLADVLHVFAHLGRTSLQWQTLAALMAEQMPEAYAGTTPDAISAQVRAFGVPSEQVKVGRVNLQGCKRQQIETAIRRREITGG